MKNKQKRRIRKILNAKIREEVESNKAKAKMIEQMSPEYNGDDKKGAKH